MNKIILIIPILFIFACSSENINTKINSNDTTKIEFSNNEFNFGTIEEGEVITYTFQFKNTGNKPLIINSVHTSCGCTVPSYSDEPVAINSEGYLKVTFNSAGKSGEQYKIVTVISNTNPEKTELVVTGNVNSKITKEIINN